MNHRQLGIVLLNQGAYGRAENHLRKWVVEHPQDLAAHMELVWCFTRLGNRHLNRWADCDEFYQRMVNDQDSPALLRFVRGERLHYDDREEEALDEYRAVIDAGLDTAVVRYSMGGALRELGRPLEACVELRKAYELDPGFVPAVHAYAEALFVDGRLDRLEKVADSMKIAVDDNLDSMYRNGVRDFAKVVDMIGVAVALREALVMHKRGDFKDALLHLLPIWRQQKNNPWLLRTLIYLFYRCEWLFFAKRIFSNEMPDESPVAAYAQGLMFWYEDDYEKALESYTKAIDDGLVSPLVFMARTLVFERTGETNREQEDLERAFAMQPYLAYARSELAENAYESSAFDRVIELADISPDDRELAIRYEISGQTDVATLESLRLRSLLKLGRAKEALGCVAADREPIEAADLRLSRAMVLIDAGQAKAAHFELERSVSLDDSVVGRLEDMDLQRIARIQQEVPDSFAADFCLSLHPRYTKEYNDAKKRMEVLAERYPDRPELWFHIGNLSWLLGEVQRAKDAFHRSLHLEQSDPRVCRELCKLLHGQGDIDGLISLSFHEEVREFALDYAVDLASRMEDKNLLRDIINRAIKLGRATENALHHLFDLLEGDKDEYMSVLAAFTELVPVDYIGREYVARFCLETGRTEESVERYTNLFNEGWLPLPAVLRLGVGKICQHI